MQKLNQNAFAIAGAVVSAITMILLGIMGNIGIYSGAVKMMEEWHMFFSLSFLGIITGVIEASVISYLSFYLFAWTYNKLIK